MFYSTEIGFTVGRMSDSQVEITDKYWAELVIGQAGGKVITADENGYPTLVDAAPKTLTDLIAEAEQQKQTLRKTADDEIIWRQDAVDAGIATDEEASSLAAWKKYRVILMRVDTSKPEWPDMPE